MRVRSIVLILVAWAIVGGVVGTLAYANRSQQPIELCGGSGPVGGGTPQGDAQARAVAIAARDACNARVDLQIVARKFDPWILASWVFGYALIALGIGSVVTRVIVTRKGGGSPTRLAQP